MIHAIFDFGLYLRRAYGSPIPSAASLVVNPSATHRCLTLGKGVSGASSIAHVSGENPGGGAITSLPEKGESTILLSMAKDSVAGKRRLRHEMPASLELTKLVSPVPRSKQIFSPSSAQTLMCIPSTS